jgi:hypothetical protein
MRTHLWLVAMVACCLAIGCHRAAISGGATGGAAAAAATDDYRKLALGELRALIREKLGSPGINIEAAGPNHYTGARPSPDGTIMLQLDVTVEAQRIICVTESAAGSTKDVITPQGLQAGTADLK